jgi:hypothetical protein
MNVFGDDDTGGGAAGGGAAPTPHAPGDGDGAGDGGRTGGSGTMRFQDASTAHPRPPTLAEQRARAHAQEELAAQQEAAVARAAGRRRVMIGAGVTVGVVALVGAWYLLASPDTVTASCTVATGSQADTVVNDQNCDPNYATTHGGYVSNGFVFLPLVGGGYSQYHYYYGGTGTIGQRATGGSYTAPSNDTVKTKSGSTIQRGGFGITGRSGSSGGSSGGGDEGGSHGKSGGS